MLPRFYTFYDELGRPHAPGDGRAYVPMEYYFDVDSFITTLAPMVRVVRQLPPALEEFAAEETRQQVRSPNPRGDWVTDRLIR